MDNWLFLFLGLILAYLLEFTRPLVKSFFKRRSLTIRERRIAILLERYRYIEHLLLEPEYGIYFLIRSLVVSLLAIAGLVIFVAGIILTPNIYQMSSEGRSLYSMIMAFPLAILFYLVCASLWRIVQDITYVQSFREFKEKVKADLKKLGGNPEDLDKEEVKE